MGIRLMTCVCLAAGLTVAAPADAAAREMTLPFVVGAATILLAGIVWMLVFWNAHRRESVAGQVQARETAPPDALPVALAGALLSPGAGTTWSHALATLLDLASRGLVRVEEVSGRGWAGSQEYMIHRVQSDAAVRLHERGLLDLLFKRKDEPMTSVKLSAAGRAAQVHLKVFQRPLGEELLASGLVCPERSLTKRALVRGGLVLIVVAALGVAVAAVLARTFGPWPLLVPASVLAIGISVLIMASCFNVLTTAGRMRAARWASFFRFVSDAAGGRASIADPAWFESYLPYAAVRGRAAQWVKTFERSGRVTRAPAWFVAAGGPGSSPLRRLADMLSRAKTAGEHRQHG